MGSLQNWLRLTPVVATLLTGCATLCPEAPPQVPADVPPPARLMRPPESPAAEQRLRTLLPSSPAPALGTPNG